MQLKKKLSLFIYVYLFIIFYCRRYLEKQLAKYKTIKILPKMNVFKNKIKYGRMHVNIVINHK